MLVWGKEVDYRDGNTESVVGSMWCSRRGAMLGNLRKDPSFRALNAVYILVYLRASCQTQS